MGHDIENLIKRKNEIEKKRERLLGKLEDARETLSKIDSEITEMGFDPDKLEEEILKLRNKRTEDLNNLNESIILAEEIINRIESRINSL